MEVCSSIYLSFFAASNSETDFKPTRGFLEKRAIYKRSDVNQVSVCLVTNENNAQWS